MPNCIEANLHVSVFQLRIPPMNVEGTQPKCIGAEVYLSLPLCICMYDTPEHWQWVPRTQGIPKIYHMYGLCVVTFYFLTKNSNGGGGQIPIVKRSQQSCQKKSAKKMPKNGQSCPQQ